MSASYNLKILLAEDNMINQRLATILFAKLGYSCDMATNGLMAFQMYQGKAYDLILMDLHMPIMDGLESSRNIRTFEKESGSTHRAYIVALSADLIHEKKTVCLKCGLDDFIEKPLLTEKLSKIIANAIHNFTV